MDATSPSSQALGSAYSHPVMSPLEAAPAAEKKLIKNIIANGAIGFAVFLGGFVIVEPAPYELFLALCLGISLLMGLRIPQGVMPLLFLFIAFNAGGIISSFMMEDYASGIMYVAVSLFLGLTSVFFAIVIANDMGRLRLIFRVYIIAAVITTILGIIGYFGVPGFEIFTRYQRAMGAFQDPNVYAPFLCVPILYLVYGLMNRNFSMFPIRAGMLAILLLGLFLAFSRAAWGLTAITGMLFYLLLLINEQSAKIRLKYLIIGVLGLVGIVLLLAIALQIPAIYNLFEERAKAVQDYDGGRVGRFARHLIGYEWSLTNPLGIGPMRFGLILGEDTHNNFVKALMAHGWLGFVSWVSITVWTLIGGFKLLFRQRPWQPFLQITYVVFVGHTVIGNVIDTDHWRHYYLVIGIIWGCMMLEKRWQLANGETMLQRVAKKNGMTYKPSTADTGFAPGASTPNSKPTAPDRPLGPLEFIA